MRWRVAASASVLALVLLSGCESGPEHASEVLPDDVEAANGRADRLSGLVLETDWCEVSDGVDAASALDATEVLVRRDESRHLHIEHLEYDAAGCLTEMLVESGDGPDAAVPRVVPVVVDVAAVPVGSVDAAIELVDVYLNGTFLEYAQEYEQGSMGQPGSGAPRIEGTWLRGLPDAAVTASAIRDGGMYPGVWAWGLARTDTAVLKVEVRIELDGSWSDADREARRDGAEALAEELLRESHAGLQKLTGGAVKG